MTTKKPRPTTWKPGQSGNPAGRPRGSRNKVSIVKAQHIVDDHLPVIARQLTAIATRNATLLAEFDLTPADVTVKAMLDAAKQLTVLGWDKNKALGEDKKEEVKPVEDAGAKKPTFQAVARLASAK